MASTGVQFPGLWGLVLAAGLSRRSAPVNKLLVPDSSGRPLVRVTVESFVGAGLEGVFVVTGHQREHIVAALGGLLFREVFAADYADGMGSSLAAGIRALPGLCKGVLVSPSDLPGMNTALVQRVALAFSEAGAACHVIPCCGGERGHPVALGAWLRPELERLTGDAGARLLLSREGELKRTRLLETGDPGACRDRDLGN